MSNEQKIVFINRSGNGERIVVEDQASARVLEQALNQFQDQQWVRAASASIVNREYTSTKEFRVILVCGQSSFRSFSSQLSLTSLELKTKVPSSFIGLECMAYVSNAGLTEKIGLSCTVAIDQNGNSVLDFNRPSGEEIGRLQEWIQSADRKPLNAALERR